MKLKGWDYIGRNIDESLHDQFRAIAENLSNETFVNNRKWGSSLQTDLANILKTSPGQIRTIKRVCEALGLLKKGALNMSSTPNPASFMTKAGQVVLKASSLEQNIGDLKDANQRNQARQHVKGLYEEGYSMAMANYYYEFDTVPVTRLHPLRATLKALAKYGSLDKWEWYLLNTYIRADDNLEMELQLDNSIKAYRSGDLSFSMKNVVEKPKGHQYFPQYLHYAGLVNLRNGLYWKISDNGKKLEFKAHILSDGYLRELYEKG